MKQAAISRAVAIVSICVCILLAVEARSQSTAAPSSPQQREDQSFYFGTPVPHPEDLSGIWETPDGHGGFVGIHLILDTTAPVDATTLTGVRQAWLGLEVGLYRRAGAEFQAGEENYFSDSSRGGGLRYEAGRLTLHSPQYDLDLHRVAADAWAGRFHRDDFDSDVTLKRPILQAPSNQPWFVGTWKTTSGPTTTCLHIAQPSASTFLAWADTLLAWGSTQFPPEAVKPPYSWEHYGDLVKVEPAGNNVSIELGAYSAVCCPHRFHATSTDGGKEMKADWPAGPNQSPHKSKWTKMPGGTCIAP